MPLVRVTNACASPAEHSVCTLVAHHLLRFVHISLQNGSHPQCQTPRESSSITSSGPSLESTAMSFRSCSSSSTLCGTTRLTAMMRQVSSHTDSQHCQLRYPCFLHMLKSQADCLKDCALLSIVHKCNAQVFALGFVSVFDQVLEGLPEGDKGTLFAGYISALDENPEQYRKASL